MVLADADGEAAAGIDFAGIGPLGAADVLPGPADAARATGAAGAITRLLTAGAGRAVSSRCWRCKLK